MHERDPRREPRYTISVAARLVDLHPQTLRHYENLGLIEPYRSEGNRRLYSDHDIERLSLISRLTNDLGVNLAGVEVILNMTEQIKELQEEIQRREAELLAEIARLRRVAARGDGIRNDVAPFTPPLPPNTGGEGGSQWSNDQC